MSLELSRIFEGAFNTFKVFDNLSISQASETLENTPKSIWQILNHLIIWQAYQIALIQGKITNHISELETWSAKREVDEQHILDTSIRIFNTQIEVIKNELCQLIPDKESVSIRIKLFQELASHLSFHLGEIILIRRQLKNYPMPDQMSSFLNS
jgi:hypothetical protein